MTINPRLSDLITVNTKYIFPLKTSIYNIVFMLISGKFMIIS